MNENNVTQLTVHNPNDAWTQARLDLIRKSICHPSMTEPEIALFLEQCKRTGADPMLGEAYCVPRRAKITTRDGKGNPVEQWQDRYVFQMGEEGMNSRCAKFPDYRGIRFAAFFEKDTLKVDGFTGEIVHVYEPNKDRGRLRGAWAVVQREGYTFSPEILYLEEYVQRTHQGAITKAWEKSVTMIVKCARAAARRRAYPEAFGGVFAKEELQLEAETQSEATTPAATDGSAPLSKAAAVRSKIEAKLAAVRALSKPQLAAATVVEQPTPRPTPTKAAEVKKATDTITHSDMDRAGPPPVEAKSEPERVADEALEGDRSTAKLTFGDWKGKQISTLDSDTLISAAAFAEDALDTPGKVPAEWVERVKWEIKQIEAELERRDRAS